MSFHRRLACLLVATLASVAFAAPAIDGAPRFSRRQSALDGVPSTDSFVNRAYQSSAVLGHYLYIDGGEIAFIDSNGSFNHLPDNNTYSIDLSQSWTNETVTFNTIQKSAPVMNYVSLWVDRLNNIIYAFGGEQSGALPADEKPPVPPTSIWEFLPSGPSGQWTELTTSKNFEGISRPAAGIGAQADRSGFLLGGYETAGTSSATADITGFQPVPGIITFDFDTQSWSNYSAAGYSQYGTAQYGQGRVVRGFGDHSVVAFLGGETSNQVAWTDTGSNLVGFSTIYIYDPTTNSWHTQSTSGLIPQPRDRFCSVGVSGDNGTFEIFIFGGHVASSVGEPQASSDQAQVNLNTALDEVFVLSMPGFHWEKAQYTPQWPRVDHSCQLVGNRQMVVIGGLNPATANQSQLLETVDPWANGLGIFDLTEMQWSAGYDANAADYTTPQAVKDWYNQHGSLYPAQWDDQALKTYFETARSNTTTTPSSGGSSGSSGSSSNSDTSSSTPVGAIVGGVIGGIAVIAIIGALVWFMLRRKRRQPAESHAMHPYGTPGRGEQPLIGADGRPTGVSTEKSNSTSPSSTLPSELEPGIIGSGRDAKSMRTGPGGAPLAEAPAHSALRAEVPGDQPQVRRYEMQG